MEVIDGQGMMKNQNRILPISLTGGGCDIRLTRLQIGGLAYGKMVTRSQSREASWFKELLENL